MSSAHRPLRTAAAAVTAALVLAACSGSSGGESSDDASGAGAATGEPTAGGTAIFAVDSGFFGFDPNVTPAAQDARVLRQVFDSLLYLDEDGTLQPWLATDWEISEDELEYTFTVRDDVTFHDGTAFDAAAVCFNFDRIADPETASIYAIGLIGSYASCAAPDATTAVVTLATPFAPFLNNLTSPFLGMNSPTAAAAVPPADYLIDPTGSGPYEFVSYTPDDRVELVRNDAYDWAPNNAEHTGAAYLEALTFQIIPDATVRMGSVRNGSVQAGSGVPEEEVAAFEADSTLEFVAQEQSGAPYQLHFNTSKPPFDDQAVREAARAALDIDSAVSALYMGVRERAWTALAPSTIAYSEDLEGSFEFDTEAAAAMLEEAGWVEGEDGVREKDGARLEVVYMEASPNREKRQDLATFFEANLEDVGFDVEVVFEQAAQTTTRSQENEYNISGLSLVAVDPNVLYQMYNPAFIPAPGRTGFNGSHTDVPAITELLAQGQQTTDPAERAEIYAEVQAVVIEEARSVAVYVPTYSLVLNGLTGVRFDAEGYPILYDAYLAE
ncbi:ABC transporter substrate-binding protein [Georgenia faecalis]|uniref:ABC transporter substrate-binding protein n=1 Tax=Georgenia faecalis TaxID=2483799 RepID=UPI0013E067B5|nr:ABC transporter substrate-binding protein [Georgenia faecalis]